MADNERVQGGSDEGGYTEAPLSRAEQLLQAHPDIQVIRDIYDFGEVYITQRVGRRRRNILVDVEHEEGSQRHYPTVIITAYESPPRRIPTFSRVSIKDEMRGDIAQTRMRSYGLTTLVKVHVEEDEQVTTEVGYKERQQYPLYYDNPLIKFIERYSQPIPAQELVATARTGLEMLRAYREVSRDQQRRIYSKNIVRDWDNIIGQPQFYDGEPGHDTDEYIASISPRMGEIMRQNSNLSINNGRTKAIYALNALNKVTEVMLPQEMPPAPKNRKEPARRRTPGR